MPVDFRFDRVEISGFRGLRHCTIALPPGQPTYLIGGNNTGKSTVLQAIAFALRGGGFGTYDCQEFDFFRPIEGPSADEFVITLWLRADAAEFLPAVKGVSRPEPVHGIRVQGSRERDGRVSFRHGLVGADGKMLTLSDRTPLQGGDRETYRDHGVGYKPRYGRLEDIRAHLPEVWLLTPDNLERSLYHWKTGPLQRIATLLSERFFEDRWTFEYAERKHEMPDAMHRAHRFFRGAVEGFPYWKDMVKPLLDASLSGYLGRDTTVHLQPEVQTIKEWLAQQLAASFAADAGSTRTPLPTMGSGWQALIRLASLETLWKLRDAADRRVVLLFEEPETYLHPHLSRKLRSVLRRLAASGWTVVCTTHASEFVNFNDSQQIVRLWRNAEGASVRRVMADAVAPGAKFQAKVDEKGVHEFLFANRVVLCEGKDDHFAIASLLERLEVDVDGLGVSILALGGRDNIADFARVAGELGVPWCALTDEDVRGGATDTKSQAARAKIDRLRTDRDLSIMWPGSLEACCGLESGAAKPEWQHHQFGTLDLDGLRARAPQLVQTLESVATWIRSAIVRPPDLPAEKPEVEEPPRAAAAPNTRRRGQKASGGAQSGGSDADDSPY